VVGLSPEQATTSPLKREVVAKPYSSDLITVYWLQHSFWDKIEYHWLFNKPGGNGRSVRMMLGCGALSITECSEARNPCR